MDNELGAGAIIGLLLLLFSGGKKKEDEITPVVIIPPEDETDVPSRDGSVKPEPEEKKDEGPPLPEIVDSYPRPATFYQVKWGDKGLGVAKRYVASAAFLAAQEFGGLDENAAKAWASGVAARNKLQERAWRLFACNGWNDALYTTYGWTSKSLALAPTGRALRFLPQHRDNLQRLHNREPPQRGMRMKTPADKGKGNGFGVTGSHSHELLWLPGVDLKRLWESDGHDLQPGGGDWGNSGQSKKLPPPWVKKLGVQFLEGARPNLGTYGCDDMQWSPIGG